MSLVVKVKSDKSHELELQVQVSTTVKELVASVCKEEKCDEELLMLTYNGNCLALDKSMTDIGPAFLAAPVLSLLILPKVNSLKFEALDTGGERPYDLDDSEVTIRLPVGTWVETKIKGSILIESDNSNEWCLGKVLEDTGTGYLLEIFENYKFFMPPKIVAAYSDVRLARSQSVELARQKTGDEEFKTAINSARGKEQDRLMPEEKKSEVSLRPKRQLQGQAHKPSKTAVFKKGRRKSGLTTPNIKKKRRSWSAGTSNQKRRSKENLPDMSEDYRSKVKEYTTKYPSLDSSDVKMYVRVFRSELDKKRKGVITKSEFKIWIKANNIDLEESIIDELLSTLDTKGSSVNMDNFISIMCSPRLKPRNDDTRELFNKFDLDGDGIISKSELKKGMKSIFGQDIPEDKLTQMIKEADSTGRGAICFQDFRKMMKR